MTNTPAPKPAPPKNMRPIESRDELHAALLKIVAARGAEHSLASTVRVVASSNPAE